MSNPIDLSDLDQQTFNDPELRKEILALFVTQAPALQSALAASEGEARADLAHRLKGSALAIGAGDLAAAAGQLELHPEHAAYASRVETELAAVLAFIPTIG